MRIAYPPSVTPIRLDFSGSDRLTLEFQAKFLIKSRIDGHSRFLLSDLESVQPETIRFTIDLRKSRGGTLSIKAKDIGFFEFREDEGAGEAEHKFLLSQGAFDVLRSIVAESKTGIAKEIEEIVRKDLQDQAGSMKQKIDGVGSAIIYLEKMPHFVQVGSLFCFSNLSSYIYISKDLANQITDPEIHAYFKPLEVLGDFRQNSNFALLNKNMRLSIGFTGKVPPQGLLYFSHLDLFESEFKKCADSFYKSNDLIDTVLLPAFKVKLDEFFNKLQLIDEKLSKSFSALFRAMLDSISSDATLHSEINTILEEAVKHSQQINREYQHLIEGHERTQREIQSRFDSAKASAQISCERNIEDLKSEIEEERRDLLERQDVLTSETEYLRNSLTKYAKKTSKRLQKEFDDLRVEYQECRTEIKKNYEEAKAKEEYRVVLRDAIEANDKKYKMGRRYINNNSALENKFSQIMRLIGAELEDDSFFEHFKAAVKENIITTSLKVSAIEGHFDLKSFRTNAHVRKRVLASNYYKESGHLKVETLGYLVDGIIKILKKSKTKTDIKLASKKLEELFADLDNREDVGGIQYKRYFRSIEERKRVANILARMQFLPNHQRTIEEFMELSNESQEAFSALRNSMPGKFSDILAVLLVGKLDQEKIKQLTQHKKNFSAEELLKLANDLRNALFNFFAQNYKLVEYNHLEIAELERILIHNAYVNTLHFMKEENLLRGIFFSGSTPTPEDIQQLQDSKEFKKLKSLDCELKGLCNFFVNFIELSIERDNNKTKLENLFQSFLESNSRTSKVYINYKHYPIREDSGFIPAALSNSGALMRTATFKTLREVIDEFQSWYSRFSGSILKLAKEDSSIDTGLFSNIAYSTSTIFISPPLQLYTKLRLKYLEELRASVDQQDRGIYNEFYAGYLKQIEPSNCKFGKKLRALLDQIENLESGDFTPDRELIEQFKNEYRRIYNGEAPLHDLLEVLDEKFTKDLEALRKKLLEKLEHLDEVFGQKFQEENESFKRNKSSSPKSDNYCPVNFRFYRTLETLSEQYGGGRRTDTYRCEYNFVYGNAISQEKETYGQCKIQVFTNSWEVKTIRIIRPTTEFRKEELSDLITRTKEDKAMIEIKDPSCVKKILSLIVQRDVNFMKMLFGVMQEYKSIVLDERAELEMGYFRIDTFESRMRSLSFRGS